MNAKKTSMKCKVLIIISIMLLFPNLVSAGLLNPTFEYYFADTIKTYDTFGKLIKLEIYHCDSTNRIVTCKTPIITYGGPYNSKCYFDSCWNLIQADIFDTQNTFAYQFKYDINYQDSSMISTYQDSNNKITKHFLKYGICSGITYWRYSCIFNDSNATYYCDTTNNSIDSLQGVFTILSEEPSKTIGVYTYNKDKMLTSARIKYDSILSASYEILYDSVGKRVKMIHEQIGLVGSQKEILIYIYSTNTVLTIHPITTFHNKSRQFYAGKFKSNTLYNLLGKRVNSGSSNIQINRLQNRNRSQFYLLNNSRNNR